MNLKKIYRTWFVLALLICATLAANTAIPDTLAYVQKKSNTLHNRINVIHIPPEDIVVPVQVKKSIYSLGEKTIAPEGFTFALTNTSTGENFTMISDAKGNASVTLPFTEEDVDCVYQYRLYEVAGIDPSITYDDRVYEISIALTEDLFNRIRAEVTVNGAPVDSIQVGFVNVFDPFLVPDTGDASLPMLSVVMVLICAVFLILLRKWRTNQ